MSADDLKAKKLFPRNLTARADIAVTGNPVTTRPESGVENSWPGLEFDHRTLDKVFFPGLVFEYHAEEGTILRGFDPKGPAAKFFKRGDIQNGVYLAYVQGRVTSGTRKPELVTQIFTFTPPASLENWRVVRDLEAGPVAIALCKQKTYDEVVASGYRLDDIQKMFDEGRKNRRDGGFVLLYGERARYLTQDGVIDPALMPPGELTRSMCSPWQFDFTDCGCYFWASNKPDMVSSDEQPLQILDFIRRDRSGDAKRKPGDWVLEDWENDNKVSHVDLIHHYEDLKFVFGGREATEYIPIKPLPPARLLNRKEVIERLKILAAVEHALCIEYLYAYYSLKLPEGLGPERDPWRAPGRPDEQPPLEARIFTAADEVLRIAIDEMRHFRMVNEMLIELGQPWVLGRADIIGVDFPEQKGFKQSFQLKPLSAAQLDWFLKVEKASPNHGDPHTIDGMYTRILRSVEEGREFAADPMKDRLGQAVKIIIAEGFDHYHRFLRAQDALKGLAEDKYLRVHGGPKPAAAGSLERTLQDTADATYAVLLRTLDYVFKQKKEKRGEMLEAARRAMYNIDDANRSLSENGLGALFTVPPVALQPTGTLVNTPHDIGEPLRPHIEQLRTSGRADLVSLGQRMEGKLATLTDHIESAAKER
jgi:hypothetical protein